MLQNLEIFSIFDGLFSNACHAYDGRYLFLCSQGIEFRMETILMRANLPIFPNFEYKVFCPNYETLYGNFLFARDQLIQACKSTKDDNWYTVNGEWLLKDSLFHIRPLAPNMLVPCWGNNHCLCFHDENIHNIKLACSWGEKLLKHQWYITKSRSSQNITYLSPDAGLTFNMEDCRKNNTIAFQQALRVEADS